MKIEKDFTLVFNIISFYLDTLIPTFLNPFGTVGNIQPRENNFRRNRYFLNLYTDYDRSEGDEDFDIYYLSLKYL